MLKNILRCLKVELSLILSESIVHFTPPAEMLGAAIIAHGTMAGDVTYVLGTECNLATHKVLIVLFKTQHDCNEEFSIMNMYICSLGKLPCFHYLKYRIHI